jgi:hypothetical protein
VSTPFFQPVSPAAAPDPVTPAGGHGDDAGWAKVTPGDGEPAPYSISAPQDIAGIGAALDAAGAVAGAGIIYPRGPRQAQAEAILVSPQGAPSSNVFAGFPDYENQDLRPGPDMENPVQGQGPAGPDYPGTTQGGVPQFMAGLGGDNAGIPGVPPEGGAMAGSGDMDYPGTTQDGLTKYGTS